jgi:hypothetical protein
VNMARSGKVGLFVAAFLLLMGTPQKTYADTFDMAWNGVYGAGTAVLTATDEGSGKFLVSSLTGSQNGTTISGLLAPGVYVNDNLMFPTGAGPAGTAQLDLLGLSFHEGATDFNIFFFSSLFGGPNLYFECSSAVCTSQATSNLSTALTSFSITPAPEPSSLALLLAGLAGLAMLRLRKSPNTRIG